MVIRRWHLFTAAALVAMASPIHAQDSIVKTIYHGFPIIGVHPDPTVAYDVTIMAPRRALEVIVEGFDLLLQTSPQAVADLATLKENGDLVIVYYPGHPRNVASSLGTDLAYFTARSPFQQGTGTGKTFTVVFGRYIVKWGAEEIALTLSHELMGHGTQPALADRLHLFQDHRLGLVLFVDDPGRLLALPVSPAPSVDEVPADDEVVSDVEDPVPPVTDPVDDPIVEAPAPTLDPELIAEATLAEALLNEEDEKEIPTV